MSIELLLLIAALILFLLAACGINSRVNLVAAGLACWVASILVPMVG
jgi:hypothetical protein